MSAAPFKHHHALLEVRPDAGDVIAFPGVYLKLGQDVVVTRVIQDVGHDELITPGRRRELCAIKEYPVLKRFAVPGSRDSSKRCRWCGRHLKLVREIAVPH